MKIFWPLKISNSELRKKDKYQVNRGNHKIKKMEVYWAHFVKGQKCQQDSFAMDARGEEEER